MAASSLGLCLSGNREININMMMREQLSPFATFNLRGDGVQDNYRYNLYRIPSFLR